MGVSDDTLLPSLAGGADYPITGSGGVVGTVRVGMGRGVMMQAHYGTSPAGR